MRREPYRRPTHAASPLQFVSTTPTEISPDRQRHPEGFRGGPKPELLFASSVRQEGRYAHSKAARTFLVRYIAR
jgi:hypothetical protein